MSRLPTPGSDDNTWGDILNDYLGVTLNTDGSIKTGVVTSANILDATITTTDISATAGILKTQLASAVQTSLGLADTALQSVTPATSTVTGGIRLAGDLAGSGGTATSPALSATSVTAGSYGSSSAIPTFTVDGKGRLTAASAVTLPQLQSFTTTSTSNTNQGQWTKVATQTITTQLGDAQLAFLLQNNFDNEFDGSLAVVRMRTKQQAAFGNNPLVNVAVVYSSGTILASHLLAVVTQNTPSTIVDLYLQVNEQYRSYVTSIQSVTTGNNGASQLLGAQAFVATGSLPVGTLQVAGKFDPANPASSTITGGIRLTGDLGGTATAPTTPTAVHLTGNETIAGTKTFSASPYVDGVGQALNTRNTATTQYSSAVAKFYNTAATLTGAAGVSFGSVIGDSGATTSYIEFASLDRNGAYLSSIFTINPTTRQMLLGGEISMGTNKITSLATPTSGTDAANKTYVDNAVTSNNLTQAASQTTSFTAAANKLYPVNATSGAITVTLPTSTTGQLIVIKKTDSSANNVILSGTINGTASSSFPLRYQNQGKELVADGSGGWTVAVGDIDIATTLASTTLPGFIQLAGDLAGTGSSPLVAKLNGVTLNTTAPTAGQVLQATSPTAAAWTTPTGGTGTDNTKVAKTGDTMTGTLNMPNQNSIKTAAPSDIYQWFYSDPQSYNQVPFGEIWHDLLAFNKIWTVTSDTTTNGSTWTSATVNKKIFAHLESQSIQILDGTVQGIRWTFSNVAYSNGRWLMIAYTYIANQPNVTLYVQSSTDGTTWTNRHNSSYTPGVGPVWHYVQDSGGDTYLRIMMQAGNALTISSIRFYSSRWGDQGYGKEIEQPYTWNELGYIGIGKGTTAPNAPLDVVGDASITGQIHNVTNPTSAQDVATKAYVDANSGSGGVTLNTAQTITGAKTFQNDVVISSTPATTLINENQSATPTGTLYGNAAYVAGSYTRLTSATNNVNGQLEYIIPLANYAGNIDATFDIWAGGGSGADGIWFYAGSTTTATYEGGVDGYAVFFNEYLTSQVRLYFNGSQIAITDISAIGDSTWRTARFTLSSAGAIIVYINGTSVLTYTDTIRTLPGTRWGFGSRTGGSNNEHRVRNMKVTTGVATSYGITVGSTIIKNGKISNVTNPTAAQDAATKAYVDAAATGGSSYAVDVSSIGIPIIGANGITVTETASAITIGYSGSGGAAGGSTGIGNASTYSSVTIGTPDYATNVYTVPASSYVTLPLNTVVSDAYSNYSTSTYQYTVPSTGTYLITATVRMIDGDNGAYNFGIGVHTTASNGRWFKWMTSVNNSNHKSYDYTRIDTFNQGDNLKLFTYTSGAYYLNQAGLQIIRLDTTPGSGGSSGTARSVIQVTSAMTAAAIASTDYVYYWSGSTAYALTLPTAISNTSRYTIKNASTVSQVVLTTASQTIDGGTTITITPGNSVDLISTNANWIVI